MDDWLARYAAALAHGLPDDAASVDLGPGGDALVDDLARLVSRASDDGTAALATFLAGVYVGLKSAAGGDAGAAMEETARVARRIAANDPAPPAG